MKLRLCEPNILSKVKRGLFLLITLGLILSSCIQQEDSQILYGDPFIMLHNGTYYAYGTSVSDGFEVFISDDLKTWKRPKGAQLALHKDDVWGDKWFWAPEVYYKKGKFYMYYSANEHICVATSKSPLGPFKQDVKKPMIDSEKCIDSSLFIDIDGKPYLFFDRFNDGLNIWVAELSDDLEEIIPETLTKCITTSQEWETIWPRVNEGPFVIHRGDVYYMTYSGNSYESQFYGIGFATALSVFGPWTKYEGNPICQCIGNLVGIGHSAMFRDIDGHLRIAFHAHKSKEEIHPRGMYIGRVNFIEKGGKDIMTIEDNYLTPVLKE